MIFSHKGKPNNVVNLIKFMRKSETHEEERKLIIKSKYFEHAYRRYRFQMTTTT